MARRAKLPRRFVVCGDQKINLHAPEQWQDPSFTLRAPVSRPGCGDFCFVWQGGLAALHQALRRAGATVEAGPVERVGGRDHGRAVGTSIYTRDPDGNLLEFIAYDAYGAAARHRDEQAAAAEASSAVSARRTFGPTGSGSDDNAFLARRRTEHETLLAQATTLLAADPRVAAAWLVGSRGRGDADALSDIDLVVVAHDASLVELVGERRELVARLSPPLLIQDLPRNAPPGGAYLLVLYPGATGPLHVDWYWRAISGTTLPYDARLIVARPTVSLPRQPPPAAATDDERALAVARDVIFFWAMAPIAAKYIARRRPVEAFDLLRSAANALERTRRAIDPAADRPAVPLSDLLTADPAAQVRALQRLGQEMAAVLPRLGLLPPAAGSLSPDVPAHVLRFVDRIAALVTRT